MPSFSNKKDLRIIITLGTGKFGASDNNQVTIQGFRASVNIDRAGGSQMGTLKAKIYGVSQADMNSIKTLRYQIDTVITNTIQVYAIDGAVETLVFSGNIINAWGNFQSMPDVFLEIQAQTQFLNLIKAVPPRSFNGAVDVASVMSQIATSLGLAFENNGVDVKLSDVYLANTGVEQARELAHMAGCDLYFDDEVLAITPPNTPRGSIIPLISKNTGMVGYPTFDGIGLNFTTLFNPAIVFGGAIKVMTDIPQAHGQWIVACVSHNLESQMPHGAWFSNIRGNVDGSPTLQK